MNHMINWDRVESVFDWMKKEDEYLDWAGRVRCEYPSDLPEDDPNERWEKDAPPPSEYISRFYLWEPFKPPLAMKYLTDPERKIIRYCFEKETHPNVLRILMDEERGYFTMRALNIFPEIMSPMK